MSVFSIHSENLLAVELNDETVLSRAGAMVAYDGEMKFSKAILGGESLFGALKRKVANEKEALMTSTGRGLIYFAHNAKDLALVSLNGNKLFVESSALLAYDKALSTNVAFAGVHGMASGQGLFTTTVEGEGCVALMSDGPVLKLEVSPEYPLFIDPDAFIASEGELDREFIIDVNWKTAIGQASGESYQIKFTGQGIVYLQPSERQFTEG